MSNPEKTFFYYGTSDGWVPLSYDERMKTILPNGHVFLDESDCEHAFVIKDGKIMAQIMAKLIRGSVRVRKGPTFLGPKGPIWVPYLFSDSGHGEITGEIPAKIL